MKVLSMLLIAVAAICMILGVVYLAVSLKGPYTIAAGTWQRLAQTSLLAAIAFGVLAKSKSQ